jgi:RNA polymerase sigma factor (sigma-70 family)
MSAGRPDPAAVRQLMKLAGVSPGGSATDRELVERFVSDRSEAAFADLMARHGPMVLAVCRRYLRDPHAADDAFQATFIVLARKASAVQWRQSIGGWLFEVATRVARKAAVQGAKRAAREGGNADSAPEPAAPLPPPPSDLTGLQTALDDELRNLPEKLRTPVVLCHLEGLSQDEVARHLGISDGQLRGRLYRAKERLRERLLRRGFTLSAVLLALTVGTKAQAVPAVLAAATLRLSGAAADAIPSAVHNLVLGVTRDMTPSFKALAVLALFGVLGVAAAGFAVRSAMADAPQLANAPTALPPAARADAPLPPVVPAKALRKDDDDKPGEKTSRVSGLIKGTDAAKNAVLFRFDESKEEAPVELAPKTKVLFGGRAVKLDDLKPGMRGELVYTTENAGPNALIEVRAHWPRQNASLTGFDAAKGTLTFQLDGDGGVGFPITLDVAKDAKVVVDGLPAALADVPTGRKVELELGIDKKSVTGIEADGDKGDLPAVVKSYDAAANTLLVEFDASANDRERRVTLCLPVNANAKVRLTGADAKLTDLKDRTPVRLKLTPDRKGVAAVLAGPPLPPEKEDD